MNNNKFYLLFIPIILIIVISLTIIEATLNDNHVDAIEVNDKFNSNLLFYNNVIYIDYDEILNFNSQINNLINVSSSLNSLVDIFMKEDKNIKMYSEEDNKVLETNLSKELAQKLFGSYLNIKNDVVLKILFRDANNRQEVKNIDFKINKEQILREGIVKTAVEQVGNTGEKYWEWYGYNHRVEWCAVFVSWVAEQYDLIDSGVMPKFIWVKKGVDFFKEKKQLKFPNEYTPKGGDIIFYNWNAHENDIIDHVGIVEKVQNGYVYAIEGNVGYKDVQRKKYKLNSSYIYAYGVPQF